MLYERRHILTSTSQSYKAPAYVQRKEVQSCISRILRQTSGIIYIVGIYVFQMLSAEHLLFCSRLNKEICSIVPVYISAMRFVSNICIRLGFVMDPGIEYLTTSLGETTSSVPTSCEFMRILFYLYWEDSLQDYLQQSCFNKRSLPHRTLQIMSRMLRVRLHIVWKQIKLRTH